MTDEDRCTAIIFAEPVKSGKYHEYGVVEVRCSGHVDHAGTKHEGIHPRSGRVVTWVGIDDDER